MSNDYEIGATTEAGQKNVEKNRDGAYNVNPEDALCSSSKPGLHYETGMTTEAGQKTVEKNKGDAYDVNPESPLYSSSKPRREVVLVMRT